LTGGPNRFRQTETPPSAQVSGSIYTTLWPQRQDFARGNLRKSENANAVFGGPKTSAVFLIEHVGGAWQINDANDESPAARRRVHAEVLAAA